MRIVVFPELSRPSTKMRASLSERLSLRRSVCDGSRRWRGGGWVSTAATRRRESHGSEPAAPRAARSSRRQRLDRAPWAWVRSRRDVVPGGEEESSRRGGDAATRQLESDGHVVRAARAARSSAARTSCRPRPPGSAAPRAPRGDSWGRLIGGLPCFRHGGARGAPSFPPGSMVLHANSSPRSARRVGPAGMAAKRCRFVKAGRHPP